MPNTKSAEKRTKIASKKKLANQMVRSQMNTAIKKFNAYISASNIELAEKLLPETSSKIDNAAVAGVIHKNAANHKKAQIARSLHQLKLGIVVIKADAKQLKQAEQKAAAVRKAQTLADEKAARAAVKAEKAAKEAAAKKPASKKETAKKDAPKKEAPKKETAKKEAPKTEKTK